MSNLNDPKNLIFQPNQLKKDETKSNESSQNTTKNPNLDKNTAPSNFSTNKDQTNQQITNLTGLIDNDLANEKTNDQMPKFKIDEANEIKQDNNNNSKLNKKSEEQVKISSQDIIDFNQKIEYWIADLEYIVNARKTKQNDHLIAFPELAKEIRNDIANYKKQNIHQPKELMQKYLKLYIECCKQIQHNFIETYSQDLYNDQISHLSFLIYCIESGYEIILLWIKRILGKEEFNKYRKVQTHFINTRNLLLERKKLFEDSWEIF